MQRELYKQRYFGRIVQIVQKRIMFHHFYTNSNNRTNIIGLSISYHISIFSKIIFQTPYNC